MILNTQIRFEPWSQEVGVERALRVFVLLAVPDSATVRLNGSNLAARRRSATVWEIPWHQPRIPGRLRLDVALPGERHHVDLDTSTVNWEKTPPEAEEDVLWERLVQHHVEKCTEPDPDGNTAEVVDGLVHVAWQRFLSNYWKGDERSEPPLHLIVKIAMDCSDMVQDLCAHPRRVLQRERQLMPVARAQDFDDACIRWLSRREGSRLVERADARQRVLAIARSVSFDTAENRVLRDFLRLSIVAAGRYLHQHSEFRDSERLDRVARYRRLCETLLRESAIAGVPPLTGLPQRNYVLQFDVRYRQLWSWYDRLRRREDERDNLSPWRHRFWSEHVRLLLCRAIEQGVDDVPLAVLERSFHSPAILHHEADQGCFLHNDFSPGPWSLRDGRAMDLLNLVPDQRISKHSSQLLRGLDLLAPDCLLTLAPVFEEQHPHRVLVVWTPFAPTIDDAALERADRALAAADSAGRYSGLVIVPGRTGDRPILQSRSGRITCLRQMLAGDARGSGEFETRFALLRKIIRSFASGQVA